MNRPSHYCGDHTSLTTTRFGDKIYVDTRDTSLAPHILVEGDWEPWVTNAIGKTLIENKGCLFIDVGANVGWYTLLAARFGASHVYAFEPNPRMVELLRKTIAVNGMRKTVTLVEAACGAVEGHGYLGLDPEEAGGAHIREPKAGPGPSHSLRIVRLDDAVMARHLTPSGAKAPLPIVIKIDVEGFEPHVIAGAPEIMVFKPILFIEHGRDDAHAELLQSLWSQGYELRHVQHTGHTSEPLPAEIAAQLENAETIQCVHRKDR